MRRGNLELIDFFNYEIASLRSQRRLKCFFNSLLKEVGRNTQPVLSEPERSYIYGF